MFVTVSPLSAEQAERVVAAAEIWTGVKQAAIDADEFVVDKFDSAPDIDYYNNYSKDGITAYSASVPQAVQAKPSVMPETASAGNGIDSNGPDIKAVNSWIDPLLEEKQAIYRSVYGRRAAESRCYPDPERHARERYYDPSAPHYVGHDLNDWEKDFCYVKERNMIVNPGAFTGLSGFTSGDPILEGRGLGRSKSSARLVEAHNWQWSSAGFRFHNRNMVTSQLNGLLSRNGICIPVDLRLSFTIDSQHRLRVTGTDDENLIAQLENLLNANGNSGQLYEHILRSTRTLESERISGQVSENSLRMYRVDSTISRYTDYTRQDLKLVEGKFLTPDGVDIFEFVREGIANSLTSGAGELIEHNRQELEWLARVGPENIPEMVLSIDYENGNLFDVGQPYGYGPGQTGWILDLLGKTDPNMANPLLCL